MSGCQLFCPHLWIFANSNLSALQSALQPKWNQHSATSSAFAAARSVTWQPLRCAHSSGGPHTTQSPRHPSAGRNVQIDAWSHFHKHDKEHSRLILMLAADAWWPCYFKPPVFTLIVKINGTLSFFPLSNNTSFCQHSPDKLRWTTLCSGGPQKRQMNEETNSEKKKEKNPGN